MSVIKIENQRKWREHIAKALEHEAGMASYCRENGISGPSLLYWRKKLGTKPVDLVGRRSPFIPVQVLDAESLPRSLGLPDAKWVADLILHLSAGTSRSNR